MGGIEEQVERPVAPRTLAKKRRRHSPLNK